MDGRAVGRPPRMDIRPVLEIRNIGKRFGRTVALQGVSLEVRRGEVHALLGHNGSGKSTTVKIISGVVRPDEGRISIHGMGGKAAQVGVVHQDLALCPDASVLENCGMAGCRSTRLGTIDWVVERRVVEPILEQLAAEFACDSMVRDLSPANQTIVAIARALKQSAKQGALDLLILDEATARLRGRDADKVLATANLVARQGGGVLIVTHHMAEVMRAAQRATVLLNGAVAGVVDVHNVTEEVLLELVSGRKVGTGRQHPPIRSAARAPTDVAVLSASRLAGERFSCDGTFTVHAGEIVGLTGAPGAGHEEVPYLIAGASLRGSATVRVEGVTVPRGGMYAGKRCGIGLVPAERLSQGLLQQASVRENLSPLVHRAHIWACLVVRRREQTWARSICSSFGVRTEGPDASIATLSGGHQQKVLLARVLATNPKVLLLHEPTEGVDEATRRMLLAIIGDAAARGAAVLYVSSDVDEVAECADRVLVVRDGALAAEFHQSADMVDRIYAACYLNQESASQALAS